MVIILEKSAFLKMCSTPCLQQRAEITRSGQNLNFTVPLGVSEKFPSWKAPRLLNRKGGYFLTALVMGGNFAKFPSNLFLLGLMI